MPDIVTFHGGPLDALTLVLVPLHTYLDHDGSTIYTVEYPPNAGEGEAARFAEYDVRDGEGFLREAT